MSLETKHYVATAADIKALADAAITGEQSVVVSRGAYLRALVATTQAELGAEPRQRAGRSMRLPKADIPAHMDAFNAVAKRFYAVVAEVAKAIDPAPDNAAFRTRTAFARSAASTVRGFIRAGRDIRAIVAERVTKGALRVGPSGRKLTVAQLERRAQRLTAALEDVARKLTGADAEAARKALMPAFALLAKASGATTDPRAARAEHRPLRSKDGFFVPMGAPQREPRRTLQ